MFRFSLRYMPGLYGYAFLKAKMEQKHEHFLFQVVERPTSG